MSRVRDLKKQRDARILSAAASLASAWQWARARDAAPAADELSRLSLAATAPPCDAPGPKGWELVTPMSMARSGARPRSCPPSKRLAHRTSVSLAHSGGGLMVPFGMLGRGRLVSQEEAAVARQQRRWFRLKEGIETLWEKLHVSLEERSMFATTFFGCAAPASISVLEGEHSRLTDLLEVTDNALLCIRRREEALEALVQLASGPVEGPPLALGVHHFRLQTMQCIETLHRWRMKTGPGPEVLWQRTPYLWKVLHDTERLAATALPCRLPFEVRGNALLNPQFRRAAGGPPDREPPDVTPALLERIQCCETLLGIFLSRTLKVLQPPLPPATDTPLGSGDSASEDGQSALDSPDASPRSDAPSPPSPPPGPTTPSLSAKVQQLLRRPPPRPPPVPTPAAPPPPPPAFGRRVRLVLRRRPAGRRWPGRRRRSALCPAAPLGPSPAWDHRRSLRRGAGVRLAGKLDCTLRLRHGLREAQRWSASWGGPKSTSGLHGRHHRRLLVPASRGDVLTWLPCGTLLPLNRPRGPEVRIQCSVRVWLAQREVGRRRAWRAAEEQREAQQWLEQERCGAALVLQRQWRRRCREGAPALTVAEPPTQRGPRLTPPSPAPLSPCEPTCGEGPPGAGESSPLSDGPGSPLVPSPSRDPGKGHRRQRLQLDPASLIPVLDLRP